MTHLKDQLYTAISKFLTTERIVVTGNDLTLKITCYEVDPNNLPKYFTISKRDIDGNPIKYQYGPTINGKRVRWVSYSAIFQLDDIDGETVSHLCHNNLCHNPKHLVVEDLDVNKARNGCPGPTGGCQHVPKCLMQGPFATNGDNPGIIPNIPTKITFK